MNSIKQNGFLLMMMLLSVSTIVAQSISGNVKDQAGMPLVGVNVILDGTSKGAVTDYLQLFLGMQNHHKVLQFKILILL